MGRLCSRDSHEQVVEAAATTSGWQAAARFGLDVATSIRWMATLTTTGTVAARPQGRARLPSRRYDDRIRASCSAFLIGPAPA